MAQVEMSASWYDWQINNICRHEKRINRNGSKGIG
jgi:hypothetical protein